MNDLPALTTDVIQIKGFDSIPESEHTFESLLRIFCIRNDMKLAVQYEAMTNCFSYTIRRGDKQVSLKYAAEILDSVPAKRALEICVKDLPVEFWFEGPEFMYVPKHQMHTGGTVPQDTASSNELYKHFDLAQIVRCPHCGVDTALSRTIIHLNDYERWSIDQIADWLEASGADIKEKT